MKNFKKILGSIGMLGVAVPAALSVVACAETVKDYGVHSDVIAELSKIINDQAKNDITGKLSQNLKYDELFGIKEEGNDFAQAFWDEILYKPLEKAIMAIPADPENGVLAPKYTEEQAKEQVQKVHDYAADGGLSLIYVNNPLPKEGESVTAGDQKIVTTFVRDDAKFENGNYKTVKQILFDEVNKQLIADGKDPLTNADDIATTPNYEHASLGFVFNNLGSVKLANDASQNFWTFTFTENGK